MAENSTTTHTPGETSAPQADHADLADLQSSVQFQTLALSFYYSCAWLDCYSQLQNELTDMRVDLEAQSLLKRKNLRDSAM